MEGPSEEQEVIDLTGDSPFKSPAKSVVSAGPDEERYRCTICFRSMLGRQLAAAGKCGHVFCKECLDQSVERSPACPTCRAAMTPDDVIPLFF